MNLDELTRIFTIVGAPDPAGWAESQIKEGIPQLGRYLFLRQAWKHVVLGGEADWIEEQLRVNPAAPGGAIAGALKRILDSGASPQDITMVVRVMQWRLLFALCYLLDDPGELEREISDVSWGLFQTDAEGNPTTPLHGLHESVLETDPTGREMCSSD